MVAKWDMGQFSKICTIVIAFLGRMVSHGYALSISLSDVECVSEHVFHDGDTVSRNFVVTDHDIFWSSGHPGIDFTVTAPGGNMVHSLKGTSGDKFEFKASHGGIYKLCFHNAASTPETVSFYIHVGHIPNEHDFAKDDESTRKRVVFYTILEYLLFAATSLLQVVYIRRLFSKSFAYYRV